MKGTPVFSIYFFSAKIPAKPWYDPDDTDANNERAKKAYGSVFIITPYVEASYASENNTLYDGRGSVLLEGIYDGLLLYAYALGEIIQEYAGSGDYIRGIDVINRVMGATIAGKQLKFYHQKRKRDVFKYILKL